jgi:hypothetical protein
MLDSFSSTVVEHLTLHPKIVGSSPVDAPGKNSLEHYKMYLKIFKFLIFKWVLGKKTLNFLYNL